MMQYKLVKDKSDQVMYIDGAWHGIIPFNTDNPYYQDYLKWVAEGNEPLPAENE